jgi:hypothetical protein
MNAAPLERAKGNNCDGLEIKIAKKSTKILRLNNIGMMGIAAQHPAHTSD